MKRKYLMKMHGSKLYKVTYLASVVKDDIPDLTKSVKTLIQKAIEERISIDPVSFGKPLRYSLQGHRRLRISDYRIIYRIDQDNIEVVIVAIKHRRYVYKQF